MFIQKHLSLFCDGCFYSSLLIIASCSSTVITPDDSATSNQTELLDIGFTTGAKPTSIDKKKFTPQLTPKIVPTLNRATFKIVAVGDIMLGTNYPFNHLPDKGIDLLAQVKPFMQNTDISFGNLEGVLLEEGEPAKKCSDLKRCYVFKSPTSYAKQLKDAGFTMMSLANNHSRDFGEEGRVSTMAALDEQGILHSGIVDDFARTTIKNRKFVMIAFAPFRGVNDMLDMPLAGEIVKKLATENDVVIVSIHGGAEGEDKSRLPFETEYFYNEDRGDVVKFSRTMIDSGADVVLGHGPHVPRAMELYKNRLIAYSLGNFATYYGINVQGLRGLAPILEFEISSDGQFIAGQIHSFRQNRPRGPEIDPSHQSAQFIKALSLLDFPDNMLQISATGELRIRTQQPTIPAKN